MKLLSELLAAALNELGERGILDWFPGDNEPESFITDVEMDISDTVAILTLCGYYVFVLYDAWDRAWRGYHVMSVARSEIANA